MTATCSLPRLPSVFALPLVFALAGMTPYLDAGAAMIADDSFNTYAAGDLAGNNGGTGWTTAWASATAFNDIVAGGLDYSNGTLTIDGGANTMQKSSGGGGLSVDPYFNRSFTSTSSSEVWMSFLFQSSNLSGTDFLEFYLSDATGEDNSGASLVNLGNPTNKLGVRANGATALSSYGGGALSAGTTYLLVMRISGDGTDSATNYDRVEFWLNPSSVTLGTATASVNLDIGISSLAFFGVRANALASSDVFRVDELKIGTAAVDVVPEPGSVSLLGLSILGFVLLKGRNRSRWNPRRG